MPSSTPSPESPRASWAALFQQTTDAVFLLNPRRRLRYVNHAFETLTRANADAVVHEYCNPRKIQKDMPAGRRALLQTLAPPAEVMKGRDDALSADPFPPPSLGRRGGTSSSFRCTIGEKLIGVIGVIVLVGKPASTAGGKGLAESLIALRQRVIERYPLALFDGESPEQRRIHAQAELAAKTLSPVWIAGAPGTGKQTLARAIHYHGVTRELAFASIDCAGLQPYLIRSLLFGHNGLAETGRVGTIYLNGPELLPADLQAELIEWGELLADECRIIVGSTSDSLSPEFRAVFGVMEIQLPTLSQLPDILPRIIASIVDEERQNGILTEGLSPAATTILLAWNWPANVRELPK